MGKHTCVIVNFKIIECFFAKRMGRFPEIIRVFRKTQSRPVWWVVGFFVVGNSKTNKIKPQKPKTPPKNLKKNPTNPHTQ